MKRNTILYIGLVVGICILIATLVCNITFGFFHLVLVFAILMFWQMSRPPRLNAKGHQNQPMNPKFAYSGAACLMIMLLCCYWALNNYVNPSTSIFMNSDHHAVSIDSIKIKNPNNYRLAGNSKLAFFDNLDVDSKAYVNIAQVDKDSVKLLLKGITTPLYRYVYDNQSRRNVRQILLNQTQLPVIHRDKDFTLINNKGERLTIRIEECHTGKWKRLFTEGSFYASDSTNYYYKINGTNITEVSEVKKFIRTGLSLENILPEISGFDLEGISLLRPVVYPIAERNEIAKKLNGDYVINFSYSTINRGEIVALEYEGKKYSIEDPKTISEEVSIAYNQSIVFGYGEKRTKPITFQKGVEGLNMLLVDPCYRYLATVSEGNGEDNTVYITSSLATEKECVDPLLPDNVLLFDFFHHKGNVHNVTPSYLSFVNGNSNEKMNFNVHVKGSNNIVHIKAGDKYPFTPTQVPGEEWCLSIKDFKADSPFSITRICGFLFLVTFVAAFVLVYGESRKKYYQHSGVLTYSNIEFGAYMLLIVFLTIRLFLLWRLSVFPPSSSISSFELHNFFLQEGLWKCFYFSVFVFFLIILYLKKCVICYKEPGWFDKLNILNLFDILKNKFIVTDNVGQNVKRSSYVNPFDVVDRQREEEANTTNSVQNNTANNILSYLKLKTSKNMHVPDWKYLKKFIGCALAIGVFSYFFRSMRLCSILLPVVSYFIGDMILTSRYARSYMDDMKEPDNDYIRHSHLFPFIVTSLNLLYWTVILYFNDSGYGILFLSFGLIWMVLRLREIDMFAEGHAKWTLLLLMTCFVLLIVFYKDLILRAVSNRLLFVVICACIGFVLTYLIVYVILDKKRIRFQIPASIGGAIVVSLMALILSVWIIPGSHTEQRVRVHMSEPAEQLENLPNQEAENRFIQASLNDYILRCYYDEGDNINLFGSKGEGYFHMLPHSKIGALWGAQTSDISLSRFVIAEHGQWLPIALIFSFLILLCIGLMRPAHSRVVKGLYIQIPLLLFVQSLVIWMAVTRHFIFLGQDFPLLSCNSKLTIIYTLLLLALWIIAAVYDSLNTMQRSIEEDEQIQRACKKNMIIFGSFMAVIAIGLFIRGVYDQYKEKYTMSSALDNVAKIYNEVKIEVPDSVLFQAKMFVGNVNSKKIYTDNNSDDDETSIEDTPIGFTLNELIEEWQNKRMGGNRWIQNIHDTRDVMSSFNETFEKYIDRTYSNIDSTKLAKRLYEHYVKKLAMHNDYNNILHMHRDKSNGKAILTVKSSYYDMQLPSRKKHSWIGNIIEYFQHKATRTTISKDNYSAQRFPGKWFTDGQDVVIARIKNEKGTLSIASSESEAPIVMSYNNNELARVVRIFPTDNITSNGNHQTQLTSLMATNSFFARNIQVNGERRFVYPMGDTLYWAKNFAYEAWAEGQKRLREKLNPLGDIPLTLSMNLTRDIYKAISDGQHERAVVVADGDGHIRALVDSKSQKYKIDPNDLYRYERLCDSIYMIGGRGSKFERLTFGTLALQHLLGGPGSTQKPLVYSAVTSGFNLDNGHALRGWNELYLDTIRHFMRNGKYFEMPQYAGIKTYKKFKSSVGDEGSGSMDIAPDYYIYRSSNYYNSMIVYIGSHNVDNFSSENLESFLSIPNKKEGNTLFYKTKPSRLMTEEEYVASWPIMHHNKSKVFGGFNLKPDYDQNKSLLHNRMKTLFGLPSTPTDTSYYVSIYPSLSHNARIGYAYPEISYLDASARSKERAREFAEISIRQTATGQRSVWNVSPLYMAQMYCRLLPGQANVSLNLDPMQNKAPWRNLEQEGNRYFDKTLKSLYSSMSQVYGPSGTAKALSNITSLLNGKEKQQYWVYGKTGTINRTKGHDDCLLVTIITNQDITKSVDEKTFRYFVIYSVLYGQRNGQSPRPVQGEIIKKVIDNPIFREYMLAGQKNSNNSARTPVTRIGDI
jgi:hypothetical protein